MNIRKKIFSGFLIMGAMLIVAGGFSIRDFSRINISVTNILEDNHRSIEATNSMLKALDKENNAILLILEGNYKEGNTILGESDSAFLHSLAIAEENITEKNEDKFVTSIETKYNKFKDLWPEAVNRNSGKDPLKWYYESVYGIHQETKVAVLNLMSLNQNRIYSKANALGEDAKRAIMPGIVAIVSALFFLVLFNFFINYYFVSPVNRIIRNLKSFNPAGTGRFNADIETTDELKGLEDSINELIQKYR